MATGLPRPYAHSKDGWELMARLTISEAEVSTGALYASAFHSQIRSVLTHYLSVAAGRFLSVFFFFLSLCFPLASLLCKKSLLHHSPSLPLYS